MSYLTIRNLTTGETEVLSRDVRHAHPQWVHEQCGTASESELQRMQDQVSLDEFAVRPGQADVCGIYMTAENADTYLRETEA